MLHRVCFFSLALYDYKKTKANLILEILLSQPYCPKKADIWSLGIILFIMLNNKTPFDVEKYNYQDLALKQVI